MTTEMMIQGSAGPSSISPEQMIDNSMAVLAVLLARAGGKITIPEAELAGTHSIQMTREGDGSIVLTLVAPPGEVLS